MRTFIAFVAALMTFPAFAAWINAQGSAQIVDDDIQTAREEAIAQAVSYASLQTGVTITSQQQVTGGRLTGDQFTMTSQLNNPDIKVISESVDGDILTVNLQIAAKDNMTSQCLESSVKAAVLIPQSLLKHREHLSYGQLVGFETALSARLGDMLDAQSRAAFSHQHQYDKLDINSSVADISGYALPTWLTEHTDSQYLLIPSIRDLSVSPAESSFMGLWQDDPLRNFAITLTLFHGISGEQIWSQDYHTQAEWQFDRQVSVPPTANYFWQSDFGREIDKTLSNAIKDMDNALICRPVLGQVIARDSNRIMINLGRKHGVHTGDKFKLVLQQQMTDRFSNHRALAHASNTEITIDQVTETSATALLGAQPGAMAIQLSDLAIKQ
ncbi:flagellar assembly protein FlgT [Shewanella corallii]|uniref:Flagellar assembly protein FlgT n=1 Tax=Shewanella corallii TaxID=560080 RepID=A0ABT0N3T2_9GAMM|nr:flagellar assembly protein FlgT [Shewanella corallii]MCL2913099.1 flagellar assembly protein FlgT [Shewanella corallii]